MCDIMVVAMAMVVATVTAERLPPVSSAGLPPAPSWAQSPPITATTTVQDLMLTVRGLTVLTRTILDLMTMVLPIMVVHTTITDHPITLPTNIGRSSNRASHRIGSR